MESQPHSSKTDEPMEDGNTSAEIAKGNVSHKRKKKLGASKRPHKRGTKRLQDCIQEKKMWTCKECGKRFPDGSHLELHQKIHLGETPFTCCECGRKFLRYDHLITHQDTHLRKKYYTVKSVLISDKNRKHLE